MILITGTDGLVGSSLVKNLIYHKKKFIALNRDLIDLENPKSFKVIDKLDDIIFVHSAAYIPNKKNSFESCYEKNKIIDKNVFDYLKNRKHHLIFISSANVYDKSSIITEDTVLDLSNKYLEAKIESENMFQSLSSKNKLTILRINSPYNYSMKSKTVLSTFINNASMNRPITVYGDGSRTQDFTHVEDISTAIVNSFKQSTSFEIINIASGNSISMIDLAKLINEKFNNHTKNITFLKEKIEKEKINFDISKAKKILNWSPKFSIEKGISQWKKNL